MPGVIVGATKRNPMFLLRFEQRALSFGLFHAPPRNTRRE